MRALFFTLVIWTATSAAWADPLRIMPLGDSITAGYDGNNLSPGGYRTTLYGLLHDAGYEFDLVGSQQSNPGPIPDNNHEGHGSYTIEQIRQSLGPWVVANRPDIVLLLAGTNDVTTSIYTNPELTVDGIASRLDSLLNDLYFYRPNAIVFVGTIPMAAVTEQLHTARSAEINALFPGIVSAQAALGRSVHLVDLRARLTPADIADRIHPSPEGYAKLGYAWFDAIESVFPPPYRPPHDPVTGDWNLDGYCNYQDWWIFKSHWRAAVDPLHAGDMSGDGFVDMKDYILFRAAFVAGGGSAASLSPVPEPSTLAIGSLTLLLAAVVRLFAGRHQKNGIVSRIALKSPAPTTRAVTILRLAGHPLCRIADEPVAHGALPE